MRYLFEDSYKYKLPGAEVAILVRSDERCTEPAVQGCKQEKYLERLLLPQSPPSMLFGRPVSQQGLESAIKFAHTTSVV